MKKIFTTLLLTAFAVSSLFADMVVPVSQLPQNARNFIQSTFPGVQIFKVERDDGKFDVNLSNGTSVKFLLNGDWSSIDSEYNPIPSTVLPSAVQNTLKNNYPQASITEIEKEFTNYKVKLNNMMELYISSTGDLIGQKMND